MREIRFRAWDKKEKKMYQWPFIIHHWDNEIRVNAGKKGYTQIPMEDIELMQFIGLKDINDKEIYEGDVTLAKRSDMSYVVVFFNGTFGFTPTNQWSENKPIMIPFVHFFEGEHGAIGLGEAEVIGNIYENPELLK